MMQTMKVVLGLVMIVIAKVSTDMAGECDMVAFYSELGCTPMPKTDNSSMCPEAFTCPDLHPDPTMCYYRGTPYSNRSPLPQNVIQEPCAVACSCQVNNGQPKFECAVVDCVESITDIQPDCVMSYEVDSCCSTGSICGKDGIANLKTCEFDGKTYREGEIIEPENTIKTCICTGEWDGTVEDVNYCRDINCGLEIHYQDSIMNNCAPIYIPNRRACPIGFECQTPTSKIIRSLNIRNVGSQCVFGNLTLNVGDEVSSTEQCNTCRCDVPPFVTCTRQIPCNE